MTVYCIIFFTFLSCNNCLLYAVPFIQLSASSYTINEVGPNVNICAELFNVLSSTGTASQINVTLQIVDGTAGM